jgi:hypothetical protein
MSEKINAYEVSFYSGGVLQKEYLINLLGVVTNRRQAKNYAIEMFKKERNYSLGMEVLIVVKPCQSLLITI